MQAITQEANLTDAQNYTIIKNALRNTANPVILYLYPKPIGSPGASHSVLAYGYNNSGLLIYDVNLPGTAQAISFDAGTSKFNPYNGFNGIIYGFDHGAGHPLLFLDDPKAPNYRKNKEFNGLGNYSKWPKVAGAVIKASFTMVIAPSHLLSPTAVFLLLQRTISVRILIQPSILPPIGMAIP